jgi:anti-anti-sigma factor
MRRPASRKVHAVYRIIIHVLTFTLGLAHAQGVTEDTRPESTVVTCAGVPGGSVVLVAANVRGDEVRIGLTGEIDASNAARLREALSELDVRQTRVSIDMSALTFVDCTGLAMLRTLDRSRRGTGRVRLEGIRHPTVRRIVELTNAMEQTVSR